MSHFYDLKQLVYAAVFMGLFSSLGIIAIIILLVRNSYYSKNAYIKQRMLAKVINDACKSQEGIKEMLSAGRADQRRGLACLAKISETQAALHTMATTRNQNENKQTVNVNNVEKAKEYEEAFLNHMAQERRKMQEELDSLRRKNKRLSTVNTN